MASSLTGWWCCVEKSVTVSECTSVSRRVCAMFGFGRAGRMLVRNLHASHLTLCFPLAPFFDFAQAHVIQVHVLVSIALLLPCSSSLSFSTYSLLLTRSIRLRHRAACRTLLSENSLRLLAMTAVAFFPLIRGTCLTAERLCVVWSRRLIRIEKMRLAVLKCCSASAPNVARGIWTAADSRNATIIK